MGGGGGDGGTGSGTTKAIGRFGIEEGCGTVGTNVGSGATKAGGDFIREAGAASAMGAGATGLTAGAAAIGFVFAGLCTGFGAGSAFGFT
jgi:hypothetical protein